MNEAKARRSQLLSTYGVGGLFPSESTSFMIAGLHEWNADRADPISEPRLARSLGVSELKAPPAGTRRDVPVIRFPFTQVCPDCRRIGTLSALSKDWNVAKCSNDKADLSPFRLIIACRNGHIDEFPYFKWLHKGQDGAGKEHQMKLKTLGTDILARRPRADLLMRSGGSLTGGGYRGWLPFGLRALSGTAALAGD